MNENRHVIRPRRKLLVALSGALMATTIFTLGALPAGAAIGNPGEYGQTFVGNDEVCPTTNAAAGTNGVAQDIAGSWGGAAAPGYWVDASNYRLAGEICNYGYAGYFGGNIANTQGAVDAIDTGGIAAIYDATGLYTYDAKGYVAPLGTGSPLMQQGATGAVGYVTNTGNTESCGGQPPSWPANPATDSNQSDYGAQGVQWPVGTSWGANGPAAKLVSASVTPNGQGLWAIDQAGKVYEYGSASYLPPSAGYTLADCANWLSAAVTSAVTIVANPVGSGVTQGGYAVAYSDGCIRSFSTGSSSQMSAFSQAGVSRHSSGDWSNGCYGAPVNNSGEGGTETWLNSPVVAAATTPTGDGIVEVTKSGSVCATGNITATGGNGSARNWCVTPISALASDEASKGSYVTGIATDSTGAGYWVLLSDGAVYSFGDATYYGGSNSVLGYTSSSEKPSGNTMSSPATCTVEQGPQFSRNINIQYSPSAMTLFNAGDPVISFPSPPYVGTQAELTSSPAATALLSSLGYTPSGGSPSQYYDPLVGIYGVANILWGNLPGPMGGLPGNTNSGSMYNVLQGVNGGTNYNYFDAAVPEYYTSGSDVSATPFTRQALAGDSSMGSWQGYFNGGAYYIAASDGFTFPAHSALAYNDPVEKFGIDAKNPSGQWYINGLGLVNPNTGTPSNDEAFSGAFSPYSGNGSFNVVAQTAYAVPTMTCVQAAVGDPVSGTYESSGWTTWNPYAPTLSTQTSSVPLPATASEPVSINTSLAVTSAAYGSHNSGYNSVGAIMWNMSPNPTTSSAAVVAEISSQCAQQNNTQEWNQIYGSTCVANIANPFANNTTNNVNGVTKPASTGGTIEFTPVVTTATGGTIRAQGPISMTWLPTAELSVGTLSSSPSSSTAVLNGETTQVTASADGTLPGGYGIHIWQVSDSSGTTGVTELTSSNGCGGGVSPCTATATSATSGTRYYQAVIAPIGSDPAPSWSASTYEPTNTASSTWGTGSSSVAGSNSCLGTGSLTLSFNVGVNGIGTDGAVALASSSGQKMTIPGQYTGTLTTSSGRSVYVTYAAGVISVAGWSEGKPGTDTYVATVTFGASVSPGSAPSGTPPSQSFVWSACSPGVSIYPT